MKEEKIFASDDVTIKEVKRNVDVFISRLDKGFFEEEKAREHGSTHNYCECGNDKYKHWTKCSSCRNESAKEKFSTLEEVEWDGVSMMVEYDGEQFFSDMDEVIEYLEDHDIAIEDAQIMMCEKRLNISEVNIDELNEECTDMDGEGVSHYYPEIAKKVQELNDLINQTEPRLWWATNKRVKIIRS